MAPDVDRDRGVVGLGRFELPTSPLSGVRSNRLSYRPSPRSAQGGQPTGGSERDRRVREERETKTARSARWVWSKLRPVCSKPLRKGDGRPRPTRPFGCVLRKEVIQPQVPLRLPCYDFTPVADPTVVACLPCGLAQRLRVKPTPMV